MMRVWIGTSKPGQMGQTRGPALSREVDVREETREAARCFFKYDGTGRGDHPPRNTWRGDEHAIYWLLRMCHHMTSPATPPLPKNWSDREKAYIVLSKKIKNIK